jgi:excisionase family DNA binding protein
LSKRGVGREPKARREPEQKRPNSDSRPPVEVREFYTVNQLAELLQLTEMTIYRMINRGELPCYAIGRVKRFRHRDVEEFLDSCRVPAVSGKSFREPQ